MQSVSPTSVHAAPAQAAARGGRRGGRARAGSLRRVLVTRFLVAGLVPLLAGAGLLVVQARTAATATARQNAGDRAVASAAELDRTFAAWRTELLVAADNPALLEWYRHPQARGQLRPTVDDALLTLHRIAPDLIDEACFIDASGPEQARQVKGVTAPVADLSPDEGESAFFAATFALPGGQVHQNAPYVSADSHRWVISNSTPLVLAGRKVALLHFETNLEAVRAQVAKAAGAGRVIRVVDPATGTVIADSRSGAPVIAQPFLRAGSRALPAGWQTASATLAAAPGDDNVWRVDVAVDGGAALDGTLAVRMGALLVLAGLALVVLARRSAAGIVLPLREVTSVAHALAAGDLTRRARVRRGDEIGQTAQAVDDASDALHRVVSSIVAQAVELAAAADQLARANALIESNATHTGDAARHAAGSAHEVRGHVQSLRAAAEEMAGSFREIAGVAAEASGAATSATRAAQVTGAAMLRLQQSSSEVDSVVRLISAIAEQTNLLALNATIEAARAGDAGKGFAVVAGEVKGLAQQTGEATGEVTGRISSIQADTASAVEGIEGITEVITTVYGYQERIASAVEDQSATTRAMAASVTQTAVRTDDIATNLAGVAEAAATTTGAVADARDATLRLGRVNVELQALVAGFRR